MANTLKDGEVAYIQGSGKKPYELKNTGGSLLVQLPSVAEPERADRRKNM